MSANNKAAAAWHGAHCDGECCRTHKGLGVCFHGRACQYHLREQTAKERAEINGTALGYDARITAHRTRVQERKA